MKKYHRVFLEANGEGPWPCYGCGQDVTDLFVHHIDENHENDAPENLAAMHTQCHSSLHHSGKRLSVATRTKIAESVRGMTHSAEARRKISDGLRGKKRPPRTEQHRKKLSDANRGRKHTEQSRQNMSASAKLAWARRRELQERTNHDYA